MITNQQQFLIINIYLCIYALREREQNYDNYNKAIEEKKFGKKINN